VLARGQGLGYNGTGVGLLLDREGNDVYESKAISAANAAASSVRSDAHLEGHAVAVRPDAHFANVSHMENVAQGAGLSQGLGGLKDGGGVDVYRATTSISAIAQPETEQVALDPASSVAILQAAGARQGAGYLLDVGDSGGDTFQSTPLRTPTCYGTRGEDVWADCYQMQSNDVLLSLGWNR
jgi:hypothetical protein